MTALTASLDPRIAVAGVACFTTSYDTLLPSIGPQDSEQSTPNFIASGLDFPDWSELFAPKPYAIIATTEDMFPFAGAQSTEKESRAFYTLFNAQDNLAFITGPGHHGNLRPILSQILDFFTLHLHPTPSLNTVISTEAQRSGETPVLPASAPQRPTGPPPPVLPTTDTQVTPTGQVSTSYPNTETIYTLNLKRAAEKIPAHHNIALAELQKDVRDVTRVHAQPWSFLALPADKCDCRRTEQQHADITELDASALNDPGTNAHDLEHLTLHEKDGTLLPALFVRQESPEPRGAVLLLVDDITDRLNNPSSDSSLIQKMRTLADEGKEVLVISTRPSPPGTEETKSPVLGTFYLSELRAELTGNTLLGLRLTDVEAAIDFLEFEQRAFHFHPIKNPISPVNAEASGHMALVLLHAAILDLRLTHITLHALPPTYTEYLHQPIPHDAPQDILPGVLLHYDTPDLIRALGPRVTILQ